MEAEEEKKPPKSEQDKSEKKIIKKSWMRFLAPENFDTLNKATKLGPKEESERRKMSWSHRSLGLGCCVLRSLALFSFPFGGVDYGRAGEERERINVAHCARILRGQEIERRLVVLWGATRVSSVVNHCWSAKKKFPVIIFRGFSIPIARNWLHDVSAFLRLSRLFHLPSFVAVRGKSRGHGRAH